MNFRTGIGIDFHRFGEGRKLILGGVEIDYPLGLIGHSDADCLIHAIVDSILGAMGLGDIGTYFPDTEARYKDADSKEFLCKALDLLIERDYKVENIDSIVICEKPKIMPYTQKMKEKLSEILNINPSQIGIKATTTEQMGFIGRKEGIACLAVCLLSKNICKSYEEE
ncbi:MAG: 2-C-methyl-D-erythritol 2,4-cyclodiphosphate synthase [Proteobacteria bacterium]|nr:2-C-methyl-D-erythritol 2,4-cyclodiphosphate synthase [Pseudomonadota bacterium]